MTLAETASYEITIEMYLAKLVSRIGLFNSQKNRYLCLDALNLLQYSCNKQCISAEMPLVELKCSGANISGPN